MALVGRRATKLLEICAVIALVIGVLLALFLLKSKSKAKISSVSKLEPDCKYSIINDGICDDSENSEECNFDGGDCCSTRGYSRERCVACSCYSQTTKKEDSPPPSFHQSPSMVTSLPTEINWPPLPSNHSTYVLVVGKSTHDFVFEVINAADASIVASQPSYHLLLTIGASTVLVEKPGLLDPCLMSCGGSYPMSDPIVSCYSLTDERKVPNLLQPREAATSLKYNDSHYLLIGGSSSLPGSEWITFDATLPGPEMFLFPDTNAYVEGMCAVLLDEDTIFFAGGYSSSMRHLTNTWKYNFLTKNLTAFPNLNHGRENAACEMMETQDGIDILVVFNGLGSMETTELLPLESTSFIMGPTYPYWTIKQSVAVKLAKNILLVAGTRMTQTPYSDKGAICKFTCASTTNCAFAAYGSVSYKFEIVLIAVVDGPLMIEKLLSLDLQPDFGWSNSVMPLLNHLESLNQA